MIIYIQFGNIFEIDGVHNYAHGCNCAGAMGKGIALQFKQKFPKMYKEYKLLCDSGKFNLGDVFEYNYGDGIVFNLATQSTWKSNANLLAIEQSIEKMLILASTIGIQAIALPKIGAGLGGLSWENVNKVIIAVSMRFPTVKLFIVENFNQYDNQS